MASASTEELEPPVVLSICCWSILICTLLNHPLIIESMFVLHKDEN